MLRGAGWNAEADRPVMTDGLAGIGATTARVATFATRDTARSDEHSRRGRRRFAVVMARCGEHQVPDGAAPSAMPRSRAAAAGGSAGTVVSDHAEASHQIGVDTVELLADCVVGRPPIRRRHVLGSRYRRRKVGK